MMTIRKFLLCGALCATFFASGCMHVVAAQTMPLSPSELNANPSRYNGHEVVVQGYVTLEPEGHTLYESKRLNEEFRSKWDSGDKSFNPKDYVKYCLTIANPQILYENRAAVAGKTLIVKGKFIDNYLDAHTLDLGACPLPTAIIVDEADLIRRYPSIKASVALAL